MSEQRAITKATERLGIIEWLKPGEYDHVEETMQLLRNLDIRYLRTGLSWADWHTPDGRKWFDWLIPRVAGEVELLPCFTYTPPSLGIEAKTSSPPRRPKDYADFIDVMITRYGRYFDWLELWNEPNNINDWDWQLDPDWNIFTEMIGMASHWARHRGKKTVLAGMAPTDPNWLNILCSRGALTHIDAVGLHGFPGTWEFNGESWADKVAKINNILATYQCSPELWLTEVGYSTWRYDDINQIKALLNAVDAPVQRIYWYSAYDLHPQQDHQDGFHEDERHYHFGLKAADGSAKLIYRIWQKNGLDGLRALTDCIGERGAELNRKPLQEVDEINGRRRPPEKKVVLLTGGAGFIGTNVAERLIKQGETVLIFDNLGRPGVERNLDWLCSTYGSKVQVEIADVRNAHLVRDAVRRASKIYHFAAQVAVTTSLTKPLEDFDINVRGTLNILESLREMQFPPPLLFTSTNKVYGALEQVALKTLTERYQPAHRRFKEGIDETYSLDFHSPYGCSKGAADQYVLDYVRSYGLQAVVFRMSCIYGPHQFGNEDQGWVAHFLIQAMNNQQLTLYGDGRQVRDILFIDDLVQAMLTAQDNMAALSGHAFNIGGGAANSISLLELLRAIEQLCGRKCSYSQADWRQGDQKYYVADSRAFQSLTGWRPTVDISSGLAQLYQWVEENVLASSPGKFFPLPFPDEVMDDALIR